jgi:hypothetical protein
MNELTYETKNAEQVQGIIEMRREYKTHAAQLLIYCWFVSCDRSIQNISHATFTFSH